MKYIYIELHRGIFAYYPTKLRHQCMIVAMYIFKLFIYTRCGVVCDQPKYDTSTLWPH